MNLIVLFTLAASLIAAGDGEETSATPITCPCEKLDGLRAKFKFESSEDQILSCEKCKKYLAVKPKEELIAAGCDTCHKPPKATNSEELIS